MPRLVFSMNGGQSFGIYLLLSTWCRSQVLLYLVKRQLTLLSDERALSLLAVKTNRAGHQDEPVHAAATRIQNKFCSYKGRKEFLILRQRVVKIQAHVKGHRVRKN